jgi:hypothetical protein
MDKNDSESQDSEIYSKENEDQGEIEDDLRYQTLCKEKIIKHVSSGVCFYRDIEMGYTEVYSIRVEPRLGSYGFANCVAICGWGTTKDGEKFLGFRHALSLEEIEGTLKDLKNKFIETHKCLIDSIEFFVVGGYPQCREVQKEFLDNLKDYKKDYNIKEIKFNISEGDDDKDGLYYVADQDPEKVYGPITVVMTEDDVFYSTNPNNSIFKAKDKVKKK